MILAREATPRLNGKTEIIATRFGTLYATAMVASTGFPAESGDTEGKGPAAAGRAVGLTRVELGEVVHRCYERVPGHEQAETHEGVAEVGQVVLNE